MVLFIFWENTLTEDVLVTQRFSTAGTLVLMNCVGYDTSPFHERYIIQINSSLRKIKVEILTYEWKSCMKGLQSNIGLDVNSAFPQQFVHSAHSVYSSNRLCSLWWDRLSHYVQFAFTLVFKGFRETVLPLPLLIIQPLHSLVKHTALKMFHWRLKTFYDIQQFCLQHDVSFRKQSLKWFLYVEISSSNSLRLFSYYTREWKQAGSHVLCSSSSFEMTQS
jgi:hypothetical protein